MKELSYLGRRMASFYLILSTGCEVTSQVTSQVSCLSVSLPHHSPPLLKSECLEPVTAFIYQFEAAKTAHEVKPIPFFGLIVHHLRLQVILTSLNILRKY
jgi:hypothetical protein